MHFPTIHTFTDLETNEYFYRIDFYMVDCVLVLNEENDTFNNTEG
jgi:hypothetical protein